MKTWFITGTSKGFGRVWAEAALKRGDRVAATARRVEALDDLVQTHGDLVLPLALDVTDKGAAFAAVQQAHAAFGRLDVVVNNAGYGLFGAVEEINEHEARAQMETNFFGALWVTQAALPLLRAQGSGHILQVTSIGGVTTFPTVGLYHASKWALEGMTQALNAEVKDFGIKVTLIEPTGYATDWGGPSAVQADPMPAYADLREKAGALFAQTFSEPGDPAATGPVILQLADMPDPPLRLFLGRGPLGMIRAEYAGRLAEWEKYNTLAEDAHGAK